MFKFSVSASLIIQKEAGGFSLSPNLQFRPIVPAESPVFCLLREAEKGLKSPIAGIEIERAKQKLLVLLVNGKGACLDTLPNGDTILHQQATLDICSDLLNSGGYMTHQALDWRHHPNVFNPAYYMNRCDGRQNDTLWQDYSIRLVWKLCDEKELQDIDLPEELQPLIYRSRNQLLSLLQRGINMQTWVDSYTQWPSGLALLFQYGHTPTETCLIRACEADCEESLKLLISTSCCTITPKVLKVAAKQHNPAILILVVQALASRRKQLLDLADRYLPDEVKSHLGIPSDYLLDIQAYEIYQLLKEELINIDNLEEQYEWTVYDCIGANLNLADLLWDSGFRDLDKEYKNYRTCLMKLWSTTPPCSLDAFLKKANWFITKGADLDRQKSGSSTTALHYLGHDVGKFLQSMEGASNVASELHQLSTESKDLMRKILVDDIYDDCCCPCSLDGCSGLTSLLNGLFQTWPDRRMEDLLPILAMVIENIEPLLEPAAQEHLACSVLRFIACQAVEITHTCVHETFGEKEISAEEISEIQEEERHLVLQLEQILVEILPPRPTLLFPDSLMVWWTHINDVILSRSALTEEDISKILEIGVVLCG
ncbi:hypothetical protein BDV12DRAFT_190252 [Aspergillus spectabilis]